jgi:hypothetical protein
MKYKIQTSYNWYQTNIEKFIIKVFYINGIAFTFDELPLISQQDPEIIQQANEGLIYNPEIFYLKSYYLIDEECHPCLFNLDLENPEDMPEEISYNDNY